MLNEKQKCKIVEDFETVGDLEGLERIETELYCNGTITEEIKTLLGYVISLNSLVVETEQNADYGKYNSRVQDLYYDMKWELLEKLGITEKYFEKN